MGCVADRIRVWFPETSHNRRTREAKRSHDELNREEGILDTFAGDVDGVEVHLTPPRIVTERSNEAEGERGAWGKFHDSLPGLSSRPMETGKLGHDELESKG